MLSNAYFLAKFRFDTAENEPAKNLQILFKKLQPATVDLAIDELEPRPRRANHVEKCFCLAVHVSFFFADSSVSVFAQVREVLGTPLLQGSSQGPREARGPP